MYPIAYCAEEAVIAVRFHEYGGSDVLTVDEIPIPEPAPGEVVVEVEACTLNHLDLDLRDGTSRIPLDLPHVLGLDGIGRIHAVAADVSDWRAGDRVMILEEIPCGQCDECAAGNQNRCDDGGWIGVERPGCYAEYVATTAQGVVRLPEEGSAVEWAGVQGPFGTSWHVLVTRGQVRVGETVLVNAAGSGIGSAGIQIAALAGARVIATAGSDAKLDRARELGAVAAVNYSTPGWGAEVLALTDGRGVDLVYDHVGGEVLRESLTLVRKGGRLATCGAHGGETVPLDVIELFRSERSIIGSRTCTREELDKVIALVAEQKLRPVIDSVYPLSDVVAATEKMARRDHFGKIVLQPRPDSGH
jgi:NADPH:quinone reductase-like Zn-dependent oxidoreductase